MKKKNLLMIAVLSSFITFTSCSSDDDFDSPANEVVEQAFNQKYPGKTAKWEMEQGYYKADFYDNNIEKEAWFNATGEWILTETDLSYQQLPTLVKQGFEQSNYAQWRVEDVEMLERVMMEPVYIIEVEKGESEYDLYFSEDGTLIKEIPDNDNGGHFTPSVPSQSIVNAVKNMYPNAQILEIENETEGIEVDILDNGTHKEVMLNSKSEWMYTKWDVLPSSLPEKIRESVIQLGYTLAEIDDAEIIEHKNGTTYYKLELERGDVEKDVYFTQDGKSVNNPLI